MNLNKIKILYYIKKKPMTFAKENSNNFIKLKNQRH